MNLRALHEFINIRRRSSRFLVVVALSLVAAGSAQGLERLEPPEGCYLGVSVGGNDTIARLSSRLGIRPAVVADFFEFPLTAGSRSSLMEFLNRVRPSRGIALITLEPYVGLSNVTEEACSEFARLCSQQETQGIGGIMVRFAHEMNGNWNPWGQQPMRYREKFRLLAQHVRTNTTRTAMLWAPSYAGGYPFGTHRVVPGTPDFLALDTDADGVLSQNDDPYEPYYPGDDAVDWVGLTLYHWGVQWPWLENELPETNSFADLLTGDYRGGNGDQTAVPDFYARYCADGVRTKPLAIPETAAFFNPHQGGAGELAIKEAWCRQVFNISGDSPEALDVASHFPKLKCVCWFDHYKLEPEQQQWIDWRISAYTPVRSAFVRQVRALHEGRTWFLTAQEFDCLQRPDCVADHSLPAILPLAGPVTLSLFTKAQTDCDLVIELLDQNFQSQVAQRAAVQAGTQAVTPSLVIDPPLVDGATYRWRIFLTPTGGDHLQALAWFEGLPTVARAITPSIQIVASPPVLASLSNFTVRVRYTAADSAVAVINLLNHGYAWHGGGTVIVGRGDGLLDVPVTVQPGVTNGNYLLECFLSDSSTNWQNPMARSQNSPVVVAGAVDQDRINVIPQAAFLPAGEVFRFAVSYAAPASRDLHVDLFDAHTNFLAGALQPVGPGSGVHEMTISHPNAQPGEHFVTAFITPSGQSWNDALAWSADRSVTVVGMDYQRWLEAHWGVLLGNDALHPQQDADGDGAGNDAERIAHTAPLDAADVLRLSTSIVGGQMMLSWRSAAVRQYQLFQRSDVALESWTPLGAIIDGTGDMLQVPIDLSAGGSQKFFRLQVSER